MHWIFFCWGERERARHSMACLLEVLENMRETMHNQLHSLYQH
jgi:hypothetical protein